VLNKLIHNSRNLFILGALLAALAFVLAFSLLSKAQQSATTQAAPVPTPIPAPALVAKTNIPAFTAIVDLKTAQQYFKEQAVTSNVNPDYVKGFSGLQVLLAQAPRHLALALPKGMQLMSSSLITNTAPGAVDFSPLLNPGEVAETISVQPTQADNGNIQPSDHVDLLVSYKVHPRATTGSIPGVDDSTTPPTTQETQTTLENLRVLNVAGTNYTLAVTHQDALVLKWAKDTNGTVDLVVRAADDSTHKVKVFKTVPVLPDYLQHKLTSPFVLP
jgi:Flp pilus assembly protein CpaB